MACIERKLVGNGRFLFLLSQFILLYSKVPGDSANTLDPLVLFIDIHFQFEFLIQLFPVTDIACISLRTLHTA